MTPHPAPYFLRAGCLHRFLLCCAFLFLNAALTGAEPARRSFDLSIDTADKSLRRFSLQSGFEVLFATQVTAKIQANPVQGEFTPKEAITRLLAGTGLTAAQDQKTGAFTVTRASDPNAVRAAQTPSDRPPPNPPVETQAGRTTGAASSGSTDEETIELSPFEVTTDKDSGFVAAGSFAGGRLATELRDTPVAYSVMTREFIDALAITDLLEATHWMTGTTERITAFGGGGDVFGNTGEFNIRGFISGGGGGGTGTPRFRNFFPAYSYSDSYNLERHDFGRGPNSILFGNGSLGGVSSATTKRAKTDRPFQTIKMAIGSGSEQRLRSELDVNQPLLNGKAAVRATVLWQDSDGWRDRDFDNRRAAFLTTTLKPFKNTEIRLEGEYYKNARQRARSDIQDRFSGWDGVTTYNSPAPLATLPGDANARGISRYGNWYVFDPHGPSNAIMNYRNNPITLGGGATATTPIAGFTQVGSASLGTNRATLTHAQGVPPGRFDTAIAKSLFRPIPDEFTTTPDSPEIIQYFRDLQLTVSQKVGENLFFEFGADVNTADLFASGTNNGGGQGEQAPPNVSIDINQVLPNGAPNPNFLQPYNDALTERNRFAFTYRSLRGAAAYIVPENRFGKFAFNVLGGINQRRRNVDYSTLSVRQGSDPRQWGFPAQQGVRIRRYWNAPSRPNPGAYGTSGLDLGLTPVNFVDPTTGVSGVIQPRWTIDSNRGDIQALETNDFDYVLGSLQARFFKDRLVLLGAVRRDTYKATIDSQKHRGDYPLDWDGTYRIFRPDAPADYHALTYQPRNAAGIPNAPVQTAVTRPRIAATGDRDPLYINDRFQSDFNPPDITGSQITKSVGSVLHLFPWFNPSFNYAETFNPPRGTPRINGLLHEPTVAKGTDYGLRMELFQRRLDLNFTYYESEEINAIDGTQFDVFNVLINANARGDQSDTGINIQGVPTLPVVYRDSLSRRSQGFEIEVAYNPTKALRLTANYSKPKVGNSNRFPDYLAYITANSAAFKQIALDAGALVDASNVATVDQSIPVNDRSPDVQAAVNAYNTIFQFQNTWTGRGAVLDDNQQRGNIFADYTFQTGWLQRLRIGAGVRYYGKRTIGNRANDTIVNPANPTQAINDPAVDGTNRIYGSAYSLVTATLAYTWKLKDGRELLANLVVNNLLNERDPLYFETILRPKGGDYTSPAREAVPNRFQFQNPISYNLSLTLKL